MKSYKEKMSGLSLAAVLATILIILPVLTACVVPTAMPEEAAPAAETEEEVVAAATPESEETVELVFWDHPLAADTKWEADFFEQVAADYHELHPNVTVTMEWVPWDVMWTTYVSSVEAGDPPDITHAGDIHMLAFVPDGEVEPLDDVLEALGGPDQFSPLLKYYQSDGHTWGLPYIEGGYILFYRKDLLEEAGFDGPPKNWDELLEVAQALTKPEENLYGIGVDYSAGNGTEQIFVGYQWAAEGPVLCEGNEVCFDDPRNAEALQFYTDLGLKYNVVPPGVTAITGYETTGTPLLNMYGNGQLAMITYWNLGALQLQSEFPEIWEKTGIAVIPAGPSGHGGSFAAANPMWIFRARGNAEEAKEFIKWYFESEKVCEYVKGSGWVSGYKPCNDELAVEEWYKVTVDEMADMWRGFYPVTVHPQHGAAWESFPRATIIQDIVVNGMSVEDALKKGQALYEEIYSQ